MIDNHVLIITGAPGIAIEPTLKSHAFSILAEHLDNSASGQSHVRPFFHPDPLGAVDAWQCPFHYDAPSDIAPLLARLRREFAHAPVDVAILAAGNRRKLLLIADMDSTIIQQECIDEIADFAGIKPKIAAITERAMRGEIAFEAALRERVGLLARLPEAVLARVMAERVTLMPGARTLVATMRANGAFCALVSGGFTYFTERVANLVGFDSNQANVLELEDGRLTGQVREPILGREAKRSALMRLVQERGLTLDRSLAVGDGANDLAMITVAGLGVAYHAKPIVAAQARTQVIHGDLTALLYLQGYRRDEFVEAG